MRSHISGRGFRRAYPGSDCIGNRQFDCNPAIAKNDNGRIIRLMMQQPLPMGAWTLLSEMRERDIRVYGNPNSRGVFGVVPGPNTKCLFQAPSKVSPDLPRATDCKALIDAGLLEPTTPEMPEHPKRCYKLSTSGNELGEQIVQGQFK